MRSSWSVAAMVGALTLSGAGPAPAQTRVEEEARAADRIRATMEARLSAMSAELRVLQAAELAGLHAGVVGLRGELARLERATVGPGMAEVTRALDRTHRFEIEAAMARARAGAGGTFRDRTRRDPVQASELRLPQDPADSLYRTAREVLNRGEYVRSAELFRRIRAEYPRSGYVGASFYLEALALQRAGGNRRLQEGLALLDRMIREHPDAPSLEDARALQLRLRAALARRGDAESAVQVAEEAAQSCEGEDSGIRAAALSALLQMDAERATPILMEVLRDRDRCSAELRKQAVFILARTAPSDPQTVELMLDLAYRDPDPDPDVRENAVFWLSRVPTEEALDALASIVAAADADEGIQETAIHALSRHESPRAGEILRGYAERADAPRDLRENAIFAIGRSDRFGGGAFLRELYGRIDDPDLRENIVFAVARAGGEENGRWILERALDGSEDVEVRRNALFWAGQTGIVGVAELRSLYRTVEDAEMKEQIVVVLGREGSSEAVDALMEIAEGEDDPELREQAVFWLGRTDDPRVPDFLLRLIRGGG